MAKNNTVKKQQEVIEDDFDFTDMDYSCDDHEHDDEAMLGLMSGMIEASHNQMLLALELTKIALDKTTEKMDVDDVFAAFRKASAVISEKFPLDAIWKKCTENE